MSLLNIQTKPCGTVLTIYNEDGNITPSNALVIGSSGSGKSLTTEVIVEQLHEAGAIIIDLTDVKSKVEGGFVAFKPNATWHQRVLNRDANNVFREHKQHSIKLWHPFTFSIPRGKLPKTEFFTIPLKSVGKEEISIIVESKNESDDVMLFFNCLPDLKKAEGISDLLFLASRKIKPVYKVFGTKIVTQPDPNNFYLDAPLAGSKKTIADLSSFFRPFMYENHYILSSEDCPLNFDVMKIFNNQKDYHVFSTRYLINEENVKWEKGADFVQFHIFKTIIRNIKKCKRPLVFKIEEINKWLPAKDKGYKEYLIDNIAGDLKITRNMNIISISSAQSYKEINPAIIGCISPGDKYIGRNESDADIMAILGEKTSTAKVNQIKELGQNEFIKYEKGEGDPYRFFVPQHDHAEPSYDFDKKFAETFPELMIDYADLKKQMKESKDVETRRVEDKAKLAYQHTIDQVETIDRRKSEAQIKKMQSRVDVNNAKPMKTTKMGVDFELAKELKRLYTEEHLSHDKIAEKYHWFSTRGDKKVPYGEKVRQLIEWVIKNEHS